MKNVRISGSSKAQTSGISAQISTNDAQINDTIQIFKYENGGATISPAPPMKNVRISGSSKAQTSGILAQISTNDAQKKALGFI